MKKNRIIPSAILILLMGSIMVFIWNNAALAEGDWQKLPPIALEDCIGVDKVLAPNPLSSSDNDFWMVLKYEERDQSAGEAGMNTGKSLNLYLVTGLAVLAEENVGLPYYRFLIVTFRDGDDSSASVQQWLLSDADNDGRLDNAKFERVTLGSEGETGQTEKMEIPVDQVQLFQDYFEKANRELNSKAENEDASQCLAS
ncbi:MAG: hypothetical protein CVU57_09060 [Deltaproteobacteria bacterium HGW-Deltaproteobacteria-15]|jgi:hypothetical protein|nr:MAG: hypothetical protein CVU57_09060 [Deltaproteobacteria bacterium HGW-Deltaproteobacteria-15]